MQSLKNQDQTTEHPSARMTWLLTRSFELGVSFAACQVWRKRREERTSKGTYHQLSINAVWVEANSCKKHWNIHLGGYINSETKISSYSKESNKSPLCTCNQTMQTIPPRWTDLRNWRCGYTWAALRHLLDPSWDRGQPSQGTSSYACCAVHGPWHRQHQWQTAPFPLARKQSPGQSAHDLKQKKKTTGFWNRFQGEAVDLARPVYFLDNLYFLWKFVPEHCFYQGNSLKAFIKPLYQFQGAPTTALPAEEKQTEIAKEKKMQVILGKNHELVFCT